MKTLSFIAALMIFSNIINAQTDSIVVTTDSISETISSFTDTRDNQSYKIVKIGDQVWMAENLNFKTEKYSYCYGRKTANCEKYGRLYRWEAAVKACPEGWHLPTDEEWQAMEKYLGMSDADAVKFNTWRGTDQAEKLMNDTTLGFNIVLGGYFNPPSNYFLAGIQSFYWTASEKGGLAWYRQMMKGNGKIFRNIRAKSWGMSVRCVKN